MRFLPHDCPECGHTAMGMLEMVPGIALLLQIEDGTFQYAGGTDVSWDSQTTARDPSGRVTLSYAPMGISGQRRYLTRSPMCRKKTLYSFDLTIDGPLLRVQRERLLQLMDSLHRANLRRLSQTTKICWKA